MYKTADQEGAREFRRKNMFLSAVLETPLGRQSVRVRNMCTSGAMIDCSEPPAEGLLVKLRRGSLHTTARVIWSRMDRCGLNLVSTVNVDEWLAPSANSRQTEVDAIFSRLPYAANEARADLKLGEQLEAGIGEATIVLADLLRTVGERFAKDPVILANRTLELQAFDAAIQVLTAIGSREAGDIDRGLGNSTGTCKHLLQAILRKATSKDRTD